eukprot:CAMPEP_0197864900 /NCGR_PEP_ID=MMETSP1438-20131217/43352_1 /TAXON_ID=1461541 /ORGANISM="Pterosperma sp., Strain CCMP1384" /LENGTH=219 /DNA_ID=CAMNT_0043483279 /DNA_START=86 /DNA_END=745 /DNA_ORIENTATION=+
MAPFADVFPVPPLGCNCSIIGDTESKKAVVVDPGGNVQVILEKLEANGLKCDKILVTHGHLDHIMGAEELKAATGASVVLHQDDLSLYNKVDEQCRDFGCPPPPPLPEPDAFISDGDVIEVGEGMKFEAIHVPGHTPGSTTYVFPHHNMCCVGDTLFQGGVGRTQWGGIPSLQGTSNGQQLIASIKFKLMTLDPNLKVVTGHGQGTMIGQEKATNPFIR